MSTEPNPVSAGLRGRCPRCGDGRLFDGFLKIAPECDSCGLDFRGENVGDGAVAFIVLIVGFAVVIPALVIEVAYGWPIWLHMIVWLPLVVLLCLILMPLFKGVLYALQYRHRAEEARHDTNTRDGE